MMSPSPPHRGGEALQCPVDLRRPAEIRAHQDRLFGAAVRRAAARHPHYRRLLEANGISPSDFRSLADLTALPLTSKSELVEDPESFRLEADPTAPDDYVLWDVAYTAGTTSGRPTPLYHTAYDYRSILFSQLRMAEIRGIGAGDRVMNLYPLTPHPHGAFMRCIDAATALGIPVVSGLSGRVDGPFELTRRTEHVVRLTVATDPTVIWGVPSYVRQILQRVATQGLDLPSLRVIAVSGEPCTDPLRAALLDLAARVGASDALVSDSLGASEIQCGLAECDGGGGHGLHNPAPELYHFSLVDDGGEPVGDGEEGRLVLTHLDRRGTVLLRYLLGDRVVLTSEPCPGCGRGGGRIVEHLGREGRFVKIRGQLVNVAALQAAVGGVTGVVEYQCVVRPANEASGGMEVLDIRVAIDEAAASPSEIEATVHQVVRRTVRVSPLVRLVGQDALVRSAGLKTARFTDERDGTD